MRYHGNRGIADSLADCFRIVIFVDCEILLGVDVIKNGFGLFAEALIELVKRLEEEP